MLPSEAHDTFLRLAPGGIGMRSSRPFYGLYLALASAMLLLSQAGLAAALTGDARSSGNWIVNGSETVSGVTEVWHGNITVSATGQLTMSNSAFVFNSSSLVRYGITVEKGGRLSMVNSRLASVNASEGFWFLAEGSVEIRDSRIENVFAGTTGLNWIGGFRIRSDSPVIENTVLMGSLGYFVRFEGCNNVLFTGNTITNASTALFLNRSKGVVKDSLFTNNSDRHIVIESCDGVEVLNNKLNDTGAGAFIVSMSRNIESRGNYYEGGLYGVYARDAIIQMEGDNVTGAVVCIDAEEGSKITLIDCLYDKESVAANSGSQVVVRRTIKVRAVAGSKSVSGAIVTVRDSNKNQLAEATTDDDGKAEFTITELLVTEEGAAEGSPFRFKAVKGIRSVSRTFATLGTEELELKMALPWAFIIGAALFIVLAAFVVASPPRTRKSRKKPR